MVKCYDTESWIRFAQDPMREEFADQAAHLLHCEECRHAYRLALEAVRTGEDQLPVTATERASAEAATAEMLKKHSLWGKFCEIAQRLQKNVFGAAGSTTGTTVQFGNQFRTGLSFAASARTTRPMNNEPAAFTFESYAAADNDQYWKMQMKFPQTITQHAVLLLRVTDAHGNGIPSGTLHFLNRDIAVMAGAASLKLSDFIRNAQCNTISFEFNNGQESHGTIRFLPERF